MAGDHLDRSSHLVGSDRQQLLERVEREHLGGQPVDHGDPAQAGTSLVVSDARRTHQLDPDETTIHLGRSDSFGQPNEIWEFDVNTGTSSVLAELPDLDTTAGSEAFITGYDSWDDDRSFYISSFSMDDSENAYVIVIDPERIRAARPDD